MERALGKIKNEVLLGRSVPAEHTTARQQLLVGIQSPVAFETPFMKN